jgi:hypothetical protein
VQVVFLLRNLFVLFIGFSVTYPLFAVWKCKGILNNGKEGLIALERLVPLEDDGFWVPEGVHVEGCKLFRSTLPEVLKNPGHFTEILAKAPLFKRAILNFISSLDPQCQRQFYS